MKGFALDENNDVLIKSNQIQMTSGDDLVRQTIQCVIGTNKKEWCLNEAEGIDFKSFLGKSVIDEEIIKNEIEQGLSQVDSSLFITDYEIIHDKSKRKLTVTFKAENGDGTVINGEYSYN